MSSHHTLDKTPFLPVEDEALLIWPLILTPPPSLALLSVLSYPGPLTVFFLPWCLCYCCSLCLASSSPRVSQGCLLLVQFLVQMSPTSLTISSKAAPPTPATMKLPLYHSSLCKMILLVYFFVTCLFSLEDKLHEGRDHVSPDHCYISSALNSVWYTAGTK